MRSYIERYTQKIKSLQRRKIILFRLLLIIKNNQRKIYNQRVFVNESSKIEIVSYEILQIVFNQSNFLIYFNIYKILFIDVNALKKLKFDIVIYYVKHEKKYREFNNKLLMIKKDIRSILFFNKYLIDIKRRY